MSIHILLIVFGGLMGFVITDEWIVIPLKKKVKHQEKEYKKLLQESLNLSQKMDGCVCDEINARNCICEVILYDD